MRLLLDTHALLWWGHQDRRLGARAIAEIGRDSNDVFVSAVSAFEIATKFRIGKLPEAYRLAHDFEREVQQEGFELLSMTAMHARVAGGMSFAHRDPFDRILIAQAQMENMALVSNEAVFDAYGVQRLW